MKQEIPKPVIIIAVIAAIALVIILGKSVLSGPAQPSAEEKAKFTPSWIDPVTNKPRANGPPQTGGANPGNAGGSPGGMSSSQPPMGSSGGR